MTLEFTAAEKDAGRTVLSVMRNEMQISAALTRRLKRCDGIKLNGEITVFTDYRLKNNETLSVLLHLAEPFGGSIPESGDLDILFENEGLLAVNKPAGILTHPSRARNTGTLANFATGYLLAENAGCHVVNRLDRDTSGIVLFAKSSYMKERAAAALKDSVKEYNAAVFGIVPRSGTIDAKIARFEERNMLRVVSNDGQRAITHYSLERILKFEENYVSILSLKLETGRTHQIRVHCKHLGYPILGDSLYNTESSKTFSDENGFTTQALHAMRLIFNEPLSGKTIEIIADAPKWYKMR